VKFYKRFASGVWKRRPVIQRPNSYPSVSLTCQLSSETASTLFCIANQIAGQNAATIAQVRKPSEAERRGKLPLTPRQRELQASGVFEVRQLCSDKIIPSGAFEVFRERSRPCCASGNEMGPFANAQSRVVSLTTSGRVCHQLPAILGACRHLFYSLDYVLSFATLYAFVATYIPSLVEIYVLGISVALLIIRAVVVIAGKPCRYY